MSPVEVPPLPVEDYYVILEVTPEATEEAIRTSYRRLARLLHPDKNPSDPNATARFQLLQTAYSTLVDAESREAYDTSRTSSQDTYDERADYGYQSQPPPYRSANLSTMDDDEKTQYFRKRIADLERTERAIKEDIILATEAMLAAKLAFRKCQESIGMLGGVATDYVLPSSRHRHGSVFINIISGPKRDLYLARQHELDHWQSKVDKLCDKVWALHNRFDNISMLRGEYINMAGAADGPETPARRMQRERDEREREDMRRCRERDRREREREMEQDREWRDIRERERELQDRLGRMAAASANRKAREEQAQRDLDAKNERIRRETEKKVEQWEWEAIERQLKKEQQQKEHRRTKEESPRDHRSSDKRREKEPPRGRTREARSPSTEKEREEREKAKAKDRKKRVAEELNKFAEAEARREAADQERGEREYRERKQQEEEERIKEEKIWEEKMREERAREDKIREERIRDERAREDKIREERLREERLREDKLREERLHDDQDKENRRREMDDKEREWARREHERREFVRREQQRRAYELEREHERLRRDSRATNGPDRSFRERLQPEEEVIMVYTNAEPPRKSRRHNHHHHVRASGSDRGSDRSSRTDRYADRLDRERRADGKSAHRGRCRHVGVWARVRGNVSCAGCRRGSNSAVVLVCPGCPKMMCRECLVEGQRASSVRMRDPEGDEYSIRSWHSR